MKRARGCLMVAFIFFCGLLVGGFLGTAFGWNALFQKVGRGGPGILREVVLERLRHDLKLTPDQRERVSKIVDETGTEITATTAEVRPKVEEIVGRNEDRIRELLNPKQQLKFDRFVDEARRRWKANVEAHRTPTPKPPEAKPAEPAVEAPASPPDGTAKPQ